MSTLKEAYQSVYAAFQNIYPCPSSLPTSAAGHSVLVAGAGAWPRAARHLGHNDLRGQGRGGVGN